MKFSHYGINNAEDEITWYWNQHVYRSVDFSKVVINQNEYNFTEPQDYFDMSDFTADKISVIGRDEDLYSQQTPLPEFRLEIFKVPSRETRIGQLLSHINFKRKDAYSYGLFVEYKFIDYNVYCAITVCIIDGDVAYELPSAIMEIGQDEGCYVQPIIISEDALDYFQFDDLVGLSIWLGNFWCGIQYEFNNRPEEVRVIEQREYNTGSKDGISNKDHIVLVKRIIPVDEEGNEIKYEAKNTGREYTLPAWTVRGHTRTLADGRVIPVRSYKKGKERNNPEALSEKEYRLVNQQVDKDLKD